VHERKVEPCDGKSLPRVLQLTRRVVDADRAGAEAGEEDRPLSRAAAELENILPDHVTENSQLALR
jgi:hypothetical protein